MAGIIESVFESGTDRLVQVASSRRRTLGYCISPYTAMRPLGALIPRPHRLAYFRLFFVFEQHPVNKQRLLELSLVREAELTGVCRSMLVGGTR